MKRTIAEAHPGFVPMTRAAKEAGLPFAEVLVAAGDGLIRWVEWHNRLYVSKDDVDRLAREDAKESYVSTPDSPTTGGIKRGCK